MFAQTEKIDINGHQYEIYTDCFYTNVYYINPNGQKHKLTVREGGYMTPEDAIKMNDLSVVNDWFEERFDSDLQQRVILNTNEVDAIMDKYNTPYILRTGVVSVVYRMGIKRTYFYGFVYDVRSNKMLYRRYDVFRRRDKDDLLKSKTYQMMQDFRKALLVSN